MQPEFRSLFLQQLSLSGQLLAGGGALLRCSGAGPYNTGDLVKSCLGLVNGRLLLLGELTDDLGAVGRQGNPLGDESEGSGGFIGESLALLHH